MTGPTAVSRNDLKDRRRQQRNQRNSKLWLFLWRLLFLSGLSLGISGIMILPDWMIQNSSEVEIQGNQKLSKEQIRSWLPIAYPQQIWRLPVLELSKHLQEVPPVERVTMARQIFPPKLTVEVTERQPVAIANTAEGEGFLDATGVWIKRSFYQKRDLTSLKLSLVVLGFEKKYRSDWTSLYSKVQNSPVKIQVIDWRNASNLILKTELGLVYFGYYDGEFSEKLLVLEKMKVLPSRLASHRIAYIDLSNPQKPTVQVIPPPVKKENEKLTI